MTSDLERMAGDMFIDTSGEEARQACLAELKPIVAYLQRRGMPVGTIIAALAAATIDLSDVLRRH